MTLFKVLSPAGAACNGGSGSYPLPKGARPGAWTTLIGSPECCQQGYHLTIRPLMWAARSEARRLFVAEGRGEAHAQHDKAAFAQVRLLFEVTPEWPLLPLYPEARVFLMMSWRAANGPDAQWPEWARNADLRNAVLRNADLRNADLRNADLRNADLRNADLRYAVLSNAVLSNADLRNADLRNAVLRNADLRNADLRYAVLSNAVLSNADLRYADLPSWLPDTYDVDKNDIVVMRDKAATS